MGLGRGLVNKVFCKSKSSVGTSDNCHRERSLVVDKSRWTSVRLYLCGDELNSVLVENDSASVKSSEETQIQPPLQQEDLGDEDVCIIAEVDEHEEELLEKERAATVIQSAFRGFMARQCYEEIRKLSKDDTKGIEDPSGVNEAASTEVLVDDSIENFSLCEEFGGIQHRVLNRSATQLYRLKEEWDDSTLSSDSLRLRVQNRLEATTRRERALAYAFSQQLRICMSKKKPAVWSDSNQSTTEPSTAGWSWLERWMATRVPENSMVEDSWTKHLEPINTNDHRLRMSLATIKKLDISFEGKESCGSNDVSVSFEATAFPSGTSRDNYGCLRNKFKAARSMSRRKTVPEYHRPPPAATKVSKKASCKEPEEKRHKQVQPRKTGETKTNDAS